MQYPPQYPQFPVYQQPTPQVNGAAVAMEAVLSLFGIYGVGWLMAGKTTVGMPLMIGGFVWDLFVITVGFFTVGIGFCCLIPLHFGFIAASTILLAANTKAR